MANNGQRGLGDSGRTITSGRDGLIIQWGDGIRQALGYSADEAVGHKIDLIVPSAMRALHWRGFNNAMASGHLKRASETVRKVNFPAVHKQGRIVPLRATLQLTHADDGSVNGAVVTMLGTGPAWQGTAWRVALAPFSFRQPRRNDPR